MIDHDAVVARVAVLVERAHWLRQDYGKAGTPVTADSLANIVTGALVALERGDVGTAKFLLAGYLAQYAEASTNPGRRGMSRALQHGQGQPQQ